MNQLHDYDYELPPELIAQHPLPQRDRARMLVVDRATAMQAHRQVAELPDILRPGDCLIFNDTRVVPARLFGVRAATGGKWEGLFLSADESGRWRLIGQTRGKLKPGEQIVLHKPACDKTKDSFTLTLIERDEAGVWSAEPLEPCDPFAVLERYGMVPLPPYIARETIEPGDVTRYQTVYAATPGAVAAPTAGLHFTPELLESLRSKGVQTEFVTLHVGIGTFRPIAVENLDDHRMHSEWCRVTAETAARLNRVRANGGRNIAVGTTAVRTLESACSDDGFHVFTGQTNLFIRPGYKFRAVDALLTNFHLPKSSLLVLVSALLGIEQTRHAYAAAVRECYRFYSYGDAMLIV